MRDTITLTLTRDEALHLIGTIVEIQFHGSGDETDDDLCERLVRELGMTEEEYADRFIV